MKNRRLWLLMVAVALLAVFAGFGAGSAVETAVGNAVIVQEKVDDDLLAAGQSVEIRAPVNGDLAVAGADVTIEQPISGYVMAAGRNVDINGPVENDLWAAGASVEINAPVGDNVILAGREVNLRSSAAVGGDTRIAAGTAAVQAPIGRNLNIAARTARIGSQVGGSVEARVQRLSVLSGALIRGDLVVSSPYAPEISQEARVLGQVRFNQIAAGRNWGWLWWWLFSFAALLILGFVALALSPVWAGHVAGMISAKPGASALTGLIALLLVPVVVVLLLVTVVGIPLAVILLALYIVAILLSGVFVAYLVGAWLLDRIHRRDASPWMRMAIGALIVSFFWSLPWIGGIVQLIVLLIGFGALVLERRDSRHRRLAESPA